MNYLLTGCGLTDLSLVYLQAKKLQPKKLNYVNSIQNQTSKRHNDRGRAFEKEKKRDGNFNQGSR